MCNSGSLLHNLQIPPPAAEVFVDVTFFQKNAHFAPEQCESTCWAPSFNVKPGQVHEAKLSKRLAARASSKRLRQQKIPPQANPFRSCTLLIIYSWLYATTITPHGTVILTCIRSICVSNGHSSSKKMIPSEKISTL